MSIAIPEYIQDIYSTVFNEEFRRYRLLTYVCSSDIHLIVGRRLVIFWIRILILSLRRMTSWRSTVLLRFVLLLMYLIHWLHYWVSSNWSTRLIILLVRSVFGRLCLLIWRPNTSSWRWILFLIMLASLPSIVFSSFSLFRYSNTNFEGYKDKDILYTPEQFKEKIQLLFSSTK